MTTIKSKRLKAGDLTVDPRVQRDHLTESKLTKIRENYRRDALGVLQISQRSDGQLIILDGWHRWTVVTDPQFEGPDFVLQCQVHTGLTLEQEAGLFVEFNRQEAANKLDLHKVRVTQKDPVALDIDKAVKDNGWAVGQGEKKIRAISALENVYYRGEGYLVGNGQTLLSNTLHVLTRAWGHDDLAAVDRNLIKALGQFLFLVDTQWVDPAKGREIDFDGLSMSLAKLAMGPKGMLDAARGMAKGAGKRLNTVLLQNFYDLYNKNRRSGRLPGSILATGTD